MKIVYYKTISPKEDDSYATIFRARGLCLNVHARLVEFPPWGKCHLSSQFSLKTADLKQQKRTIISFFTSTTRDHSHENIQRMRISRSLHSVNSDMPSKHHNMHTTGGRLDQTETLAETRPGGCLKTSDVCFCWNTAHFVSTFFMFTWREARRLKREKKPRRLRAARIAFFKSRFSPRNSIY